MNSPLSTIGGLYLTLERLEQGTPGDGDSLFSLILADGNEEEIMRLALPESFVDEIRQNTTGIELLMSLEGTISADNLDLPVPARIVSIGVDELVARDTSPDMLEDEPTATEMLARLRERLTTALNRVDSAIASLRDQR